MKAHRQIPVRSRIRQQELNPVFHFQDKQEDNQILTRARIKQALKSGVLNLSGKGLATVPEKVWNLSDSDENEKEVRYDLERTNDEESWWNQRSLTSLDLSSNTLTTISENIQNLVDLTVLNLQDNALTSLPAGIGALTKLTKFSVARNKLTELPESFFQLKELKHLNLSHNEFAEMNPNISDLIMLETLDVSFNSINALPGGVGFLVRLQQLTLSNNHLTELPNDIVNLRKLQKLDLAKNDLKKLPPVMGELRRLECFYVQHNDIDELPDFTGCEALKELHISNNYIKTLPGDFCENLPQLKVLDLRDNKIEKLPDEIALLASLTRLDLSNNTISSLPSCLSTLAHLVSLQVEGNPIRSIRRDIIQCGTQRILKTLRERDGTGKPDGGQKGVARAAASASTAVVKNSLFTESTFPDVYQMRKGRALIVCSKALVDIPEAVFLDALEACVYNVDISKNKLTAVPSGITHLSSLLTELNVSFNLLQTVPAFFSQFDKISYLNLSNNQMTDLPEVVGLLVTLRELNVISNQLKRIPDCVYELRGLEILLASGNQIEEIDATESGLGALKRLATLDLANNNIKHVPPVLGTLKNITTLELIGNSFRQPRHQILEKGTESIMSYLRDRIPQ
ncbi:AGAP006993-PA [Anopheles gambiae str. PEST]|uniref:AGAP006993-PA n=2 Tax=gambiae species complex TaxID=44542 RepID=Q7QIP3_ANOGA|nr:leucine-rich repeat-containing protein 40 isoform X1 [Anopheles coluzzii]XP_308777.4 leucine-rich repeat-containing protein 40 isoform X1 [Anopheles gambiae]EAA04662.4 AGAP006993-PA [Anopheles gambiae str. PEST]